MICAIQNSSASNALDISANDEPVHFLCNTTKGRCDEEDGNDRKKNGVPTWIAYLSATNEHTTQKLPGRTNNIREKRLMRLVNMRCIKLISINFVGNFIRLLTILPNYNFPPFRYETIGGRAVATIVWNELQIDPSMQKESASKVIPPRHMSEFLE